MSVGEDECVKAADRPVGNGEDTCIIGGGTDDKVCAIQRDGIKGDITVEDNFVGTAAIRDVVAAIAGSVEKVLNTAAALQGVAGTAASSPKG